MLSTPEIRAHAQEVLDYIIEHPEQHSQESWFVSKDETLPPEPGTCGTTMCIAGTSIFLKYGENCIRNPSRSAFSQDAADNLGLTSSEAGCLFYTFDDARALDALTAVANGDEKKFHDLIGYDPETEQDSYWGQ